MAPMVDLVMYEFTYLETGKITPELLFMNAYTYAVYESEQVCAYTTKLHNFRC